MILYHTQIDQIRRLLLGWAVRANLPPKLHFIHSATPPQRHRPSITPQIEFSYFLLLVAPPPATCLKWRPTVRLHSTTELELSAGVRYRKSSSFSIIIIISNILENFFIFATAILVKIQSNQYTTYCAANGVKKNWDLRKEGVSARNKTVSKDLFTSPRRSPAISQGFS